MSFFNPKRTEIFEAVLAISRVFEDNGLFFSNHQKEVQSCDIMTSSKYWKI